MCANKAPKTNTKRDATRTNARDGVVFDRLMKTFPLINNFAHFFLLIFLVSHFSLTFSFIHLAYYYLKDSEKELQKNIPNTKQKVVYFLLL